MVEIIIASAVAVLDIITLFFVYSTEASRSSSDVLTIFIGILFVIAGLLSVWGGKRGWHDFRPSGQVMDEMWESNSGVSHYFGYVNRKPTPFELRIVGWLLLLGWFFVAVIFYLIQL